MSRPVVFGRSWAGLLSGPEGAVVVIDDWGLHVAGAGGCSWAWNEIIHLELRGYRAVTVVGPGNHRTWLKASWYVRGRRAIELIEDRVEFTRL